jgi:hypothetical protein
VIGFRTDFSLEEHDDGDNQVHDEFFDEPVGDVQIAPLCDKKKQAHNSDPYGHLVSFCIFYQAEKRIQDDGNKEDIKEVSKSEVGQRIDDVFKHPGQFSPCLCLRS